MRIVNVNRPAPELRVAALLELMGVRQPRTPPFLTDAPAPPTERPRPEGEPEDGIRHCQEATGIDI